MIQMPKFQFAARKDLVDCPSGTSFLPNRATNRSTGWDVRAATFDEQSLVIRPGMYVKIPLGFRVLAPDGWWLELRPRSSTFAKKQLHALYGVIDNDYEGECLLACQYLPDVRSLGNDLVINFGDSVGQIIPVRVQEMVVEQIDNEEYDRKCQERKAQRGIGGFGSTDTSTRK